MADTTPVRIPYSFVEYKGFFSEPIFAAFVRKDWTVTQGIYRALQKWGMTLDQIVTRPQGTNLSEVQISFNLPSAGLTVHLSLGNLTIFMNNPNWGRAAELVELANATVEATKTGAETSLQNQQLSLGMHLIPMGRSHRDISSRYVAVDAKSVEFLGKKTNYGFALYGEAATVVVDISGLYPDGLFVKITRTHSGLTSFADMAELLNNDETQTFNFLGLHEDA